MSGKKYEYRRIAMTFFDEDLRPNEHIDEINGMAQRGWRVISITPPMPYVSSPELFVMVYFEREIEEIEPFNQRHVL